MLKMLRCCALGGVVAASLCGPTALHAQAFDSLGRPRPLPYPVRVVVTPDSSVRRINCGSSYFGNRDPAFRIIGAGGQLLFMSSADTGSTARATEAKVTSSLEPSQIVNIEVMKGAAVEQAYGKSYVSGLVVITLDEKGTEAWRRAESARAWKR